MINSACQIPVQNSEFMAVGQSYENVVNLLRIEADAIDDAASRLDSETVEDAIRLLFDCSGKIVVIGVGKSGVIAQKIAQTLTSTGTVSVYLHPSDALHGSLGILTKEDLVIALSNSGETDEILALVPTLRNRGIKILSIIGNLDSTLARQSDVVLDASVDKEACPLNLAPTTSTTVALSLGDALAMTVMQERGLTPQQFAENHPAGRLGKRLTLKVRDLMHDSPSLAPTAEWLDVVKALSKYALGAVNVVDENKSLVGLITEGDLRRALESNLGNELTGVKASEMMTTSPVTASPATLAFEALKLMEEREHQISVLPVVDDQGTAIGMIRLHDIVRSGL